MRAPKKQVTPAPIEKFISGAASTEEARTVMNWRPTISLAGRIKGHLLKSKKIVEGRSVGPSLQSFLSEAVTQYLDQIESK